MPVFTEIPAELTTLDREVRQGVPTSGWPGDPTLEVRIGVLTAAKTGWSEQVKRIVQKGDALARRIEVWRHTERGEDVRIGSWNMDELLQIIPDLVLMDPSRPGHVSVLDRIDASNAEMEAKASRQYDEAMGPMLDHFHRLVHDRSKPRNIFRGIPGTKDREDLTR